MTLLVIIGNLLEITQNKVGQTVYNKNGNEERAMPDINSKVSLNNGTQMPQLGLGVWQIPDGAPTEQAVSWALEAGYRHIDTARIYGNETGVGQAIHTSGIPRDKIWVTTKLWPADQLHAEKALDASLERLGLEYVDLYLIHWPTPGLVKHTWKKMEELYATCKCKTIGVSNHSVHQLTEILSIATVPPAVNQVKCSPFSFDKELYDFCKEKNIVFEAYSPLTRGHQLEHETLQTVAQKYGKSTAQILLRWALQHGMVVIPKSTQQAHIQQNADVFDFELLDNEMQTLDSLSK